MPELPEVETIRCQLAAALPGRRIRAVDRLDELMLADISAAEFAAALPGRRILDVQRRGKFLVLPVSDDLFLTFHLGMTGQLLLEDVAGPFRLRTRPVRFPPRCAPPGRPGHPLRVPRHAQVRTGPPHPGWSGRASGLVGSRRLAGRRLGCSRPGRDSARATGTAESRVAGPAPAGRHRQHLCRRDPVRGGTLASAPGGVAQRRRERDLGGRDQTHPRRGCSPAGLFHQRLRRCRRRRRWLSTRLARVRATRTGVSALRGHAGTGDRGRPGHSVLPLVSTLSKRPPETPQCSAAIPTARGCNKDKSEPRVNSLFVSLRLSLRRCFSVLRGHLSPRFLCTGPCVRLQTLRLNSRGCSYIVLAAGCMSTVSCRRFRTKSPQNAHISSGPSRPPRADAQDLRSCATIRPARPDPGRS